MPDKGSGAPNGNNHVKFGGRSMPLPRSQIARMALGGLLIVFGFLGFLPVLGFWMVPLGLLVLSVDIPIVRRWRRQFQVWIEKRWNGRSRKRGKRNP